MQKINELVERSKRAQKQFENFTQEEVDQVVREIGKVVYDNAEELAKLAVEETQMGLYQDKVAKNKAKSRIIWNDLKNKNSVGIINRNEKDGIVEIAKPMGVVAAIMPTTNPIVTMMSNAMFALKGRNSIIVAPHPRAKKCNLRTVELINQALKKFKTPENLIQTIEEPTVELSSELMRLADVVIATGGADMVKAAYSSGKPSYGVGPGNVQVILDRKIDYSDAVKKIIIGRTFDNGIICSGEQFIHLPDEDFEKIVGLFEEHGCLLVAQAKQKEAIRKVLFPDGKMMNIKAVGQPPYILGKMAGFDVEEKTKILLIEVDEYGAKELLSKEKMCPVLALRRYKTFKEAVEVAQANLEFEGKGHTAGIYSLNKEHIEYAGINLSVSRLVVNEPTSTTAGGSFFNSFAPSTTLGCGSWGNNSISENLTYKHMINISRIGYYKVDNLAPSDEEIWE